MSAPVADPDRRFFAWRHTHPALAEDARAVWAEAWRQGAWSAMRDSTQLGLQLLEVVERIASIEMRLRDMQQGRDIEREMEEASAYWHDEQVDESVPT